MGLQAPNKPQRKPRKVIFLVKMRRWGAGVKMSKWRNEDESRRSCGQHGCLYVNIWITVPSMHEKKRDEKYDKTWRYMNLISNTAQKLVVIICVFSGQHFRAWTPRPSMVKSLRGCYNSSSSCGFCEKKYTTIWWLVTVSHHPMPSSLLKSPFGSIM